MTINNAEIYKRNVEGAPLHQALGLNIDIMEEGESRVTMPTQNYTLNPAGMLHGGVVYLVADVASFAAVGSILGPDEFAVTIDIQCSIYKGTKAGPIVFRASVTRRTRRLAFMNVKVSDGEGALIAEARVTKAITGTVPNGFKG